MKKIAISMGQEYLDKRKEKRDFIDVKIVNFLKICFDCDVYLINNFFNVDSKKKNNKYFFNFLERHKINIVILSGGQNYGENILRDNTEIQLINYAIKKKIKLIGICRGMQMINLFFKGSLKKIKNHIRTQNTIVSIDKKNKKKIKCFHGNGIKTLGLNLDELYRSLDGEIEAFIHKNKNILGIMWHPERNKVFEKSDIKLFKKFLS